MDPQSTHPSLLSRVRDPADEQAWCTFESRYGDLIVRYARSRGLSEMDAEDVRQVVLLDLSKCLRRFHYAPERGRFRSYLGSCVRHAVARLRTRPRVATRTLDSRVLAAVPAPDDAEAEALWEREWIDHHYRLAMQTVRTTFEPRSVEMFDRVLIGTPVGAVADAFETTPQAVHKVQQRIRRRLRKLVAAQVRDEEETHARV